MSTTESFAAKKEFLPPKKDATGSRTQLHGGSVHRGTGGRGETKKLATATLP